MIGGRGGLAYLVRPDDVISGQPLTIIQVPATGKIFFERPPHPLSYIVYNILSVRRRQNIFGFGRAPQPLSQFTIHNISACRKQIFWPF